MATTLLASTMGGRVKQDFVVLEVDERFFPADLPGFSPDYLLCNNLFRDQLTRNGNVDVIIEKLHEAIKPSVKLILNGNDPISGDLARRTKGFIMAFPKQSNRRKNASTSPMTQRFAPVVLAA